MLPYHGRGVVCVVSGENVWFRLYTYNGDSKGGSEFGTAASGDWAAGEGVGVLTLRDRGAALPPPGAVAAATTATSCCTSFV